MSDPAITEMGREDIEMLLPWFAIGKLDAAEQQLVEAYLASHPEMRRQLDLIEDERTGTTVNNEAMGAPPADALARLMSEIENRSLAKRSGFSMLSGLVQGGIDWLGSRQALVPVAAAAAVAILLQAGTIGALLWNGGANLPVGKVSHTASAPSAPVADKLGSYVIVQFAPGATSLQIEQTLQPLGISIVEGPKASVYRLRLSDNVLSDAERDLLMTALRSSSDVVKFVAPAGP